MYMSLLKTKRESQKSARYTLEQIPRGDIANRLDTRDEHSCWTGD